MSGSVSAQLSVCRCTAGAEWEGTGCVFGEIILLRVLGLGGLNGLS